LAIQSACSFTGLYEASFKLSCHPSITNPANCPLDLNNNNVRIQISANSENFCTAANVNINLVGTLTSYSDNTYQVPKNAFLLDQRSYFQAQVSSPKATLKSSTLIRAQWTQGNITKVLYDNSAITPEGTNEGFVVGPSTANTAAFNFLLSSNWMSIPVDSSSDFNVSATIQVSYQAIDGTTSNSLLEKSWRMSSLSSPSLDSTLSANSQSSKYAERIQVFGIKGPSVSSGNSILFTPLLLILLLFDVLFNNLSFFILLLGIGLC